MVCHVIGCALRAVTIMWPVIFGLTGKSLPYDDLHYDEILACLYFYFSCCVNMIPIIMLGFLHWMFYTSPCISLLTIGMPVHDYEVSPFP
jgi:hypothetical protein